MKDKNQKDINVWENDILLGTDIHNDLFIMQHGNKPYKLVHTNPGQITVMSSQWQWFSTHMICSYSPCEFNSLSLSLTFSLHIYIFLIDSEVSSFKHTFTVPIPTPFQSYNIKYDKWFHLILQFEQLGSHTHLAFTDLENNSEFRQLE